LEVKKFLRAFAVVIVLIYIMDFLIGSALKWLYQNQKSGYLYRSNYCIDSTRSNYLVIGSSRANHHYDSRIFEKELNDSFYNCGRDGQNIIYSCAMASAIVHRYKPKLIIIDIRPNEFTMRDEDKLSSLLPYHNNPAIKPFLKYYSQYEDLKLLSHIYPYNSLLASLIAGVSGKNMGMEDYHGYIRLNGVLQNKSLIEFKEKGQVDSMKLEAFTELLSLLNEKQIRTFVIISPLYEKYESTLTARISSNVCSRYPSVKFLNFADTALFKDFELYKDQTHLNQSGAKLFSMAIAKRIKSLNTENLVIRRRDEVVKGKDLKNPGLTVYRD
jgi:hypothetical protein